MRVLALALHTFTLLWVSPRRFLELRLDGGERIHRRRARLSPGNLPLDSTEPAFEQVAAGAVGVNDDSHRRPLVACLVQICERERAVVVMARVNLLLSDGNATRLLRRLIRDAVDDADRRLETEVLLDPVEHVVPAGQRRSRKIEEVLA